MGDVGDAEEAGEEEGGGCVWDGGFGERGCGYEGVGEGLLLVNDGKTVDGRGVRWEREGKG